LIYGEWLADMFAEFERLSVEDWKARKEQLDAQNPR
jgi:hypothetical protein